MKYYYAIVVWDNEGESSITHWGSVPTTTEMSDLTFEHFSRHLTPEEEKWIEYPGRGEFFAPNDHTVIILAANPDNVLHIFRNEDLKVNIADNLTPNFEDGISLMPLSVREALTTFGVFGEVSQERDYRELEKFGLIINREQLSARGVVELERLKKESPSAFIR